MDSENKTASRTKKTGKKKLLILAIIIIAIPLLLFFLTPVYLSTQSGKNIIVKNINRSIDGIVGLDNLSVSWFKGLELTDLTFADNAGTISAKIKNIRSRPKFMSFIFGDIDLGQTTITNPDIVLTVPVRADDTASEKTPESKPGLTDEIPTPGSIPVKKMKLSITGGNVTVNLKQPDNSIQSVNLTDIESNININPPGTESGFDLTMAIQDGNGSSNIIALAKLTPDDKGWRLKPGSTGQCTVSIESLDIASLRPLLALAGQDIQAGGKLNAEFNVTIANGTLGELTANANLQNFTQTIGDKITSIKEPITLGALISMQDDLPIIDRLNLTSSFCTVDCTGDTENIIYTAKANLNELQNFASQFADLKTYALSGELTINGSVKLDPSNISITGNSSISKLVVAKTDTGKAIPQTDVIIAFDTTVDTEKSLLNIAAIDIQAAPAIKFANIKNATIPFGSDTKQAISGNVTTEIDIKELVNTLEVFDIAPKDMQVAGLLKADINAAISGDTVHIDTKETTIANLSIKQDGKDETFEDKLITIQADAIVNIADKTIDKFICKIDGTNINVDTNITQTAEDKKTTLAGTVDMAFDLENLPIIIGDRLPEGLTVKGKHPLKVNFTTFTSTEIEDPNQLKKNFIAKADYGFDELNFKGINFDKTAVSLTVDKGLLTIEPFTTNVNDGKLSLAGNIDLNEEPLTFRLTEPTQIANQISINDELSDELLKYINPLFANQANVSGRLNFKTDTIIIPLAAKSEDKIDIAANISMTDVRLSAKGLLGQIEQFSPQSHNILTIEPTNFTIQNGIMGYTDPQGMQVNLGDNPLNFNGEIALDKKIDMTITLPWSILGTTAKIGKDTQGRVAIPIEGTLDNPTVNLAKLIKKTTESVIKDVIQSELDKFLKKNKSGSRNKKEDNVEDQIDRIINIFK